MSAYEYGNHKVQEGLHKIDNAIALSIILKEKGEFVQDGEVNMTKLYKHKVKNPYANFKFSKELKTKIVTSQLVIRDYSNVFQQALRNLKHENIMFALQEVKETTPLENFLLFINGYDSLIKKEEEVDHVN